MNCISLILIYILVILTICFVSWCLFIKAQYAAKTKWGDIEHIEDIEEPSKKIDVLLEIYRQKYLNFRHFDTLRWGVHTVVIAAAGLVATVAGKDAQAMNKPSVTILLFGFAMFSLSGWLLLYRLAYNHMKNSYALEAVAEKLGDKSIPSVPEGKQTLSSAAFLFMCFIGAVGGAAFVTAALKFFSMI